MKKESSLPWEDVPHIWKDEKAYLNWLRSSTRRIWNRHPIKIAYKQKRRYKAPVGVNGRDVWVSDCEMCGEQSRKTEIDHIVEGGSFHDWETYTNWSKRILWVGFSDIRELCVSCHELITLAQRKGITLDEAKVERELISFKKLKADKQRVTLKNLGIEPSSTKALREEQYRTYLGEGKL